jgi:hypothetical protein
MRHRSRHLKALTVVSCVLAGLVMALGASAASAHTVLHGFSGALLPEQSVAEHDAAIAELGDKLGVDIMRIDVAWNSAEPSRATYDDAGYLAAITHQVDTAQAHGMQVIVMVFGLPKWASDRSFWGSPPSSSYSGYQPFYPIEATALDDFQRFAEHLSTLLKGKVLGYECWNEPNLWPYIYPQQSHGDGLFAAHTYVKYLKRFSPGIKAGDPDALVLAGVTAPLGTNDRYRTSPQRFAQAIKDAGVGDLFDAYSHHPYCIGGRKNVDPALPPANPATSVETGNIATLLGIFPAKPFYLTEYGYNTKFSTSFGPAVSEIQQATYLKKAFRLMARYPQVKALFWFQLRDWSPKGRTYDANGVYMGLRALGGGAKRAWYAYARGNRIAVTAPASAPRGASVRLQGTYTCASVGGVKGKPLVLQRRWGTGRWVTLRTVTSGKGGYFKTFVTLNRTTKYRLVFKGVCTSAAKLVRID